MPSIRKKSIFSKGHDGIQIVPLILSCPNCSPSHFIYFWKGILHQTFQHCFEQMWVVSWVVLSRPDLTQINAFFRLFFFCVYGAHFLIKKTAQSYCWFEVGEKKLNEQIGTPLMQLRYRVWKSTEIGHFDFKKQNEFDSKKKNIEINNKTDLCKVFL